jgi:hypothetical protein
MTPATAFDRAGARPVTDGDRRSPAPPDGPAAPGRAAIAGGAGIHGG